MANRDNTLRPRVAIGGAEAGAVAAAVSRRLGWPVTEALKAAEDFDATDTPAVMAAPAGDEPWPEARWKFYLASGAAKIPTAGPARLSAGAVLIDTAGYTTDELAAIIATLVLGEWETEEHKA